MKKRHIQRLLAVTLAVSMAALSGCGSGTSKEAVKRFRHRCSS